MPKKQQRPRKNEGVFVVSTLYMAKNIKNTMEKYVGFHGFRVKATKLCGGWSIVYMSVYVYIYIDIYIYVYLYVYADIWVDACERICVYVDV